MKRIFTLLIALVLSIGLLGCTQTPPTAQIAATTLPVYEFTSFLCQNTDISIVRLVTESVSCLHDYTLQTQQMRAIENAQLVVISGAGLEAFLDDALLQAHNIVDASAGLELICHDDHHDHHADHEHSHEQDPHIWLSPANAKQMAANICNELTSYYPQHQAVLEDNLTELNKKFDILEQYANTQLANLSCRELITFHDGFSYMADAFDLSIVHAIEEESGSEASAAELIELIQIVKEHNLSVIFTEQYGSTSAAQIIHAETGAEIFQLDMAMAGDSYFDAMYHNIDTLKEALE